MVAAILSVLAATGRSGAFVYQLPSALGTGVGAWGMALFVDWIARTTGRLQNDAASTRAVWITGLVTLVLWFVSPMTDG